MINQRSRITANLPKDYGNHEELNKRLKTLLRVVEVISLALQEKIIAVLALFKPDLNPESLAPKAQETANKQPETNLDFYFQINDYIKCKAHKVTPGMLRVYKNMQDSSGHFRITVKP